MKNTRLYLSNWEYNASMILTELENIILENGGAIVSDWKTERTETFTITNRTLDKAIRDQENLVQSLEQYKRDTTTAREKLQELQSIDNNPITNNFGNWYYITFAIKNDYYYYSMDSNPFFDFHYGKLPIINGCIDRDYFCSIDSKDWLLDEFFSFRVTKNERRLAAQIIYDTLLKSNYSQKYRGHRKPTKLNTLSGVKTWS